MKIRLWICSRNTSKSDKRINGRHSGVRFYVRIDFNSNSEIKMFDLSMMFLEQAERVYPSNGTVSIYPLISGEIVSNAERSSVIPVPLHLR